MKVALTSLLLLTLLNTIEAGTCRVKPASTAVDNTSTATTAPTTAASTTTATTDASTATTPTTDASTATTPTTDASTTTTNTTPTTDADTGSTASGSITTEVADDGTSECDNPTTYSDPLTHSFNTKIWSRTQGYASQYTFDGTAMSITITPSKNTTVLQTIPYMSSGSFEIEMQAISMSGGVSSILWAGAGILGTDAVDELDTEVTGKERNVSQNPTWLKSLGLPTPSQTSKLDVSAQNPTILTMVSSDLTSDFHTYKTSFNSTDIIYYLDGKPIISINKAKQAAAGKKSWLSQDLSVRMGPWANSGQWAGPVDWTTTPKGVMKVRNFKMTGCVAK